MEEDEDKGKGSSTGNRKGFGEALCHKAEDGRIPVRTEHGLAEGI